MNTNLIPIATGVGSYMATTSLFCATFSPCFSIPAGIIGAGACGLAAKKASSGDSLTKRDWFLIGGASLAGGFAGSRSISKITYSMFVGSMLGSMMGSMIGSMMSTVIAIPLHLTLLPLYLINPALLSNFPYSRG